MLTGCMLGSSLRVDMQIGQNVVAIILTIVYQVIQFEKIKPTVLPHTFIGETYPYLSASFFNSTLTCTDQVSAIIFAFC